MKIKPFIVTCLLILLVLFAVAPVGHILGQWFDWWDSSETMTFGDSANSERYFDASKDCSTKARKYFGSRNVESYASSTNDSTYKTYDCYGIEYTKIP